MSCWVALSYWLTRVRKNRTVRSTDFFVRILNSFWQNGGHFLSRYQIVWLPDFRSHLKSRLFATQPLFNHSKSRLVRISGPHCIFVLVNFRETFYNEGWVYLQLQSFEEEGTIQSKSLIFSSFATNVDPIFQILKKWISTGIIILFFVQF